MKWSMVMQYLRGWHISVRRLLSARGYSALVVMTLALGVGMNSAVFSVVRTLLLDALPYPQSGRLLSLAEQGSPDDLLPVTVAYGTFVDWRERSQALQSVAAYAGWTPTSATPIGAERLAGMRVTHEFFSTLGVAPALGRDFSASDDHWDTRNDAVIVDHGYWQSVLGGDPDVIGRSIELSGQSATVIGVLPREFQPLGFSSHGKPPRVWAPLGYEVDKSFACRTCQHLRAIGRLADDADLDQASSELHGIQQRLAAAYPADYPPTASVLARPLNEALVGSFSRKLWLLYAAALLVMAIVCANVAGMSSARAIARRRELAVHAAIGAGRRALLGQVLRESLLLSLTGSALGLLLGAGGLELFRSLAPEALPRMSDIDIDAGIVGYTVCLATLTGLLAGALPAWIAARSDPLLALKQGSSAALGSQPHLQRWLVAGQVCAAVVVASCGALLLRTFVALGDVDPGFDAVGVVTASTQLSARYPDNASRRAAQDELLARLQAVPGVDAAAIASTLPLAGFDRSGFQRRDVPIPPSEAPDTDVYRVSTGYFDSMRVPLLGGRLFTSADSAEVARVALVNSTLASSFWPGQNVIGKQIQLGGLNPEAPWVTV
ncbi:MAG: ABC transporter permease, partial [Xanthomonadales bacterium]|nr:ABC transporter permease [Xanthomonadales bacterium]